MIVTCPLCPALTSSFVTVPAFSLLCATSSVQSFVNITTKRHISALYRKLIESFNLRLILIYTVSQKSHRFNFCDIFVRFHPILLIFGRNIPHEIENKHMYTLN